MLEQCLGSRRLRQLQRASRRGFLTFLCLFLTVIVLRGTIGVGKFGTPEHDLDEIRHRVEPHRVLEEVQPENNDPNSYATFDISKILVDEAGGDDEKRDPNAPYTLGPKISDWDQQRARWLQDNPDYPNLIRPNKSRVLLVTGSSPKLCENPVGDHYLLKSIKNKVDYCRQVVQMLTGSTETVKQASSEVLASAAKPNKSHHHHSAAAFLVSKPPSQNLLPLSELQSEFFSSVALQGRGKGTRGVLGSIEF